MKTQRRLKPSYKQIEDAIRDRIFSGELAPGDQLPSERELEKEFNFSRITISKGLANLVLEGHLTHRQGLGTFVTNGTTKNDTRRLIQFISPLGKTIKHGVLEGMHDVLTGTRYETGIDFYSRGEEQHCILSHKDTIHAGFIIFFEPGSSNIEELKRLKEDDFPFVLIDSYPPDLDLDFVVADNVEGGRLATEHLAGLGHRKITYVTRPIDRTSLSDCLTGFLKCLVLSHVPYSQGCVRQLNTPGAGALPELEAVMEDILSSPEVPSAIFFSNDDLALEAMSYLSSRGIRVPEDLSIMGYNNIDKSETSAIPLTTVTQDFYEMSRIATRALVQKIEGNGINHPVQLFVKPRLILRSSTR